MFPFANLRENPGLFALFLEALLGDLERVVGFYPDAGHPFRLPPLSDSTCRPPLVARYPVIPEDWWGRHGDHARNVYCLSSISKLSRDFVWKLKVQMNFPGPEKIFGASGPG